MAQQIALLKKKAQGFIDGITKMNAKERATTPSVAYARDYNKLLDMVLEANPNLAELLPPKVEFYVTGYGGEGVLQNIGEILTFCQQIVQLI